MERNEIQSRQLEQRLRHERKQQGKVLQSKQQEPSLLRFFPGLTPRPAQRLAYERECSKLKIQFYKHQSLLQHGPSTMHPQVPNSLDSQSSSEPYGTHITIQSQPDNPIFSTPSSLNDNPDKVDEWRRIHSTRLRGWGIDNTTLPILGTADQTSPEPLKSVRVVPGTGGFGWGYPTEKKTLKDYLSEDEVSDDGHASSNALAKWTTMATTTTTPRRRGVIHHLLREIDPSEPKLTPSEFSSLAHNFVTDAITPKEMKMK
ncbi:hypothetical protein LguiA_016143 [Lonicera macranthoides]